jgi:hypothetical protein
MKKIIMFFAVVVLILATGKVQADIGVWTFDELYTPAYGGSFVPGGYAGFEWENMGYLDPTDGFSNSGYMAGMVSEPHVAVNGAGYPAAVFDDEVFNFGGAYLTGAWNDGLNIQVEGFFDGELKYSQTVVVSSTSPKWFDFNYYGIDRLEFSSWGGTPNPEYGTVSAYHFAMDNFTIVPVPVPGAVLLGILGLSAVGIKLRKFA